MTKKISLIIEDQKTKENFLNALKDKAKIPICKKCGKLFSLGFPNNENGISDWLICEENYLLCECENSKIIENLYSSEKDGNLDISSYYTIL